MEDGEETSAEGTVSTSEFHVPQSGHFPDHFGDWKPHCWHSQTVESRGIELDHTIESLLASQPRTRYSIVMLTKQDLSQIRIVVREEIQRETPKIVHEAIQKETPPIVERIVEEKLMPVKKDIHTMKNDLTKIRADINMVITFFDREFLALRARVERIEEHLGLTPN